MKGAMRATRRRGLHIYWKLCGGDRHYRICQPVSPLTTPGKKYGDAKSRL